MHTACIGMGGNIDSCVGAPAATLAAAVEHLAKLGRVVRRSSLYSTEPVGFAAQPRFVNAVIRLETELGPLELLGGLLTVERDFGRDRKTAISNGPRTLDLDILLMDDLVISESVLKIPHVRLAERAFVLIPLNEVASDVIDPQSGKSVAQLLGELLERDPGATEDVVRMKDECWRTEPSTGANAPPTR